MSRTHHEHKFIYKNGEWIPKPKKGITFLPRWPMPCEALAVDPVQIDEARQYDISNGIETDYTKDGQPIMRDQSHYKKYRRLHGVHQRNSYND